MTNVRPNKLSSSSSSSFCSPPSSPRICSFASSSSTPRSPALSFSSLSSQHPWRPNSWRTLSADTFFSLADTSPNLRGGQNDNDNDNDYDYDYDNDYDYDYDRRKLRKCGCFLWNARWSGGS
eukprot:GHVS01081541.1.p3 GENE.GHVS01081541.1~~GHVS01081541.1.p3  ORF type:complete len:122 (-),score=45.30 GHVS01081541.1:1958-2323(-)